MRRIKTLLAAAVLAATVLLAPAQAAQAAGSWDPRYRCGSGSFQLWTLSSQPAAVPEEPPVTTVAVSGELTCAVPAIGAKFALAVYTPGGAFGLINVGTTLVPYASANGPHPFRAEGGITAVQGVAICVVSDTDVRVTCINVSISGSGSAGTASARALSTSDPLVARPVVIITSTGVDPSCGTCWRMKP